VAGAFVSVRSEASSALPGVGIAVALVPPLATIGMSIGLGQLDLAIGATLLYLTNLVGVIVAASIVFTLAGFAAFAEATTLRVRRRTTAVALGALVLVGLPLLWQSQRLYEEGRTQATVTRIVDDWSSGQYLVDISIDRQDDSTHVTVGVVGTEPPPDSSSLAKLLAAELRTDVVAGVTFTALDEATADSP